MAYTSLHEALLRIISEIRPAITRVNDITNILIEPGSITVEMLERNDEGFPVWSRRTKKVGTIVRRTEVRIALMESDD